MGGTAWRRSSSTVAPATEGPTEKHTHGEDEEKAWGRRAGDAAREWGKNLSPTKGVAKSWCRRRRKGTRLENQERLCQRGLSSIPSGTQDPHGCLSHVRDGLEVARGTEGCTPEVIAREVSAGEYARQPRQQNECGKQTGLVRGSAKPTAWAAESWGK